MNLTERAELILAIAHRIKTEQASGRSVDPIRLEWAADIIRGNSQPKRKTPGLAPAVWMEALA